MQWQFTLPITLNLLLLTTTAPLPGLPNSLARLIHREPVNSDNAKRQDDNAVPFSGWTGSGGTTSDYYGDGATEDSVFEDNGWTK